MPVASEPLTDNPVSPDVLLAEAVADYYDDPLGFILFAFPWGSEGTQLAEESGPDDNQREFLESLATEVQKRKFNGHDPVMPIQMAETSGHGTGKSAMGAWIAWWILSTRRNSIGTVTAGTYDQLEEKTWAAIQRWGKMCITRRWFDIQASGIYHKQFPEDWKLTPQTCKEENAQSFAGQHARTSTSWYLFDEASEVPDKIWETAMGGLTDGEPMIFAWGQPVRNTGMFYRVNFGDLQPRWNQRRVDGRSSRFTNKPLLDQWIADYGIDSDHCRVRIFGLPPEADELQYIDKTRIEGARQRTQIAFPDEPIIAGFDVSGGGMAMNVIRFRQGLNGDVLPPIRIAGDRDPERSQRVGICAELLRDQRPGHKLAAMFVDSAFGAPIVVRLRALGFTNVHEVNFGGASPDPHCLNMRAYMYMKAKEFLLLGSLPDDFSLPKGKSLCQQLAIPGYHTNNSGKLVIESKADIQARGEASPDDADAFVLTWAQSVAVPKPKVSNQPRRTLSAWG